MTAHRALAAGAALLAVAAAAMPAEAQDAPITDRDYALDLHRGWVFGSTRIVGMGGAVMALAEGATGMTANPAAPAVRTDRSTGTWDWDATIDWLTPAIGSDFDNNGDPTTELDDHVILMGGVVVQRARWGLGVVTSVQQHNVATQDGASARVAATVTHLLLARTFGRREEWTVGLGLRFGGFEMGRVGSRETFFRLDGGALEVGALWRPPRRSLRAGVAGALPVLGDRVQVASCDPMNCHGYILPSRVTVPWELSAGVAWRYGPTPWNIEIADDFRDERALVVAADVVVTGPVRDGAGIEAFVDRRLQPSGRDVSVSVRAGAEYEWKPGWLRVRAGTYWEPGRFEDVAGRLHLTLGVEARIWSFCFWGGRHRLRLSLTADAADRYGNGGLSIGFWH